MASLHPSVELHVTLRSPENIIELPGLDDVAVLDHSVSKYYPEANTEIRLWLHQVGHKRLVTSLQQAGVKISRYFVTPTFRPDF